MKHKHYDVIVAWAEGKQIQVKTCNGKWEDIHNPRFDAMEYRIKSEYIVGYVPVFYEFNDLKKVKEHYKDCDVVKITRDIETEKIKSVEVVEEA